MATSLKHGTQLIHKTSYRLHWSFGRVTVPCNWNNCLLTPRQYQSTCNKYYTNNTQILQRFPIAKPRSYNSYSYHEPKILEDVNFHDLLGIVFGIKISWIGYHPSIPTYVFSYRIVGSSANWLFLNIWRKNVWRINRSANRFLIVSTRIGESMIRQTFPLHFEDKMLWVLQKP